MAEVERVSQLREKQQREHLRQHGHARTAVHTTFRGHKMVVVGSTIHYPPAGRAWITFHDFLLDYVASCFGSWWRDIEAAKPPPQRHPVYKMFQGLTTFQREHAKDQKVDGVFRSSWNGDVAGLLTLAYDLFVVADNVSLQKRMLGRLRHPEQYQGARYELFAAATCVRAGFSIEYEDESDSSTRHPEFLATHNATRVQVAVEAKSRHRHGILGFKTAAPTNDAATSQHRARVRRLLMDAIGKEPHKPYVIFIDVNLPGFDPAKPEYPSWYKEVSEETFPSVPNEQQRKVNLVLCTNVSFHYTPSSTAVPLTIFSAHEPLNPLFPIDTTIVESLVQATSLFQNVPREFPSAPEPQT